MDKLTYAAFLEWRHLEESDVCETCGGSGVKCYGSTATWTGGIGGQVITSSVCDACWGSGSKSHPGANLRQIRGLREQQDDLLAALEALTNTVDVTIRHYGLETSQLEWQATKARAAIAKAKGVEDGITDIR